MARIGPGDHFGELALITDAPRTATVTAVTSLRCYVIAFWDFRRFAKENPDSMWKLLENVAVLLHRRARATSAYLSPFQLTSKSTHLNLTGASTTAVGSFATRPGRVAAELGTARASRHGRDPSKTSGVPGGRPGAREEER